MRLIGAVLMEIDEAWSTSRRYLNMEEILAMEAVMRVGRGSTAADRSAAGSLKPRT